MKNTLKKQRLFFISLIGIVVISLSLMTTFAFQTLGVEKKNNSNDEFNIKSSVLDVSFLVDNRINLKNMPLVSDYKFSNYIAFTIDNTKSTEDVKYLIKINNIDASKELKTSDFKYTIVKVVDNDDYILGSGDFSNLNSNEFDLFTNYGDYLYIKKGEKEELRLYLWLKESDDSQNYLENTHFKGVLEINSYFAKDITVKTIADFKIIGKSEYDIENKKYNFLGEKVVDGENKDKYKIDLYTLNNTNNSEILEYSLYLNSPLKCINDVCDYIDLVNNKIVRYIKEYRLSSSDNWSLENKDGLNIYKTNINNITNNAISTHFNYDNNNVVNSFNINNNTINIVSSINSIDSFTSFLDNNNVIIYYVVSEVYEEKVSSFNLSKFIDKNVITKSDNNISNDVIINYE